MRKEYKINGLFVPLITPFYKGKFDETSMRKLIRSLDASVDGYIPCLSSGEGKKLSAKEWKKIISSVCRATKKPVFAGILRGSEKEVFALVQIANKLLCAGVVVQTLYDTDEKNLKYLKETAGISSKRIILYNTEEHPLKSVTTLKKLDSLSKIVAIKDSSVDMSFFKNLVALNKQSKVLMSIFQGMEHLLLQSAGCNGYVISLLNTEPKLCKTMFQKQDKITNDKIIGKFWEQNLGGMWYTTIKGILYERGIIKSAEEVNLPVKP